LIGSRRPGEFSFDLKFLTPHWIHCDVGNGHHWITTTADAALLDSTNGWYHLACVVTPTNYTIYINGSPDASKSYPLESPLLYDDKHQLIFGNLAKPELGYLGDEYLNGQIAEARIWSTARTPDQIQANAYHSLVGSEPGLMGYWLLDKGAATTFDDASGHGFTGKIVNSPDSLEGETLAQRLSVAILPFEYQGDDEKLTYWRHTLLSLLHSTLTEVKSLRVSPANASGFAFNHLHLNADRGLNPEQARAAGELMETRRVIWGSVRPRQGKWLASVRVLNVATGDLSPELAAKSSDWFEIRDHLTAQLLSELQVKATEEELGKMRRRWTDSQVAFEAYCRALSLYKEDKPFSEQVALSRQAVAADPAFAEAHYSLAWACFGQSQFGSMENSAREVLRLRPAYGPAHAALGVALEAQQEHAEAEEQYRAAVRQDPDDPDTWHRLGEYAWHRRHPQQAIQAWRRGLRLEFTQAEVHAHLALAHAIELDREKATTQLKLAEWFNPENDNTEVLIAMAYSALGDFPAASEHFDKHVAWSRKRGIPTQEIDDFERSSRELKQRLTPAFLTNSTPKTYSTQDLQAELLRRLTVQEFQQIVNPIAANLAMTNWARELTLGGKDDWEKARKLFDALSRHFSSGPGGARTAQEVFAAWPDPHESFSCQEYAKLFVALARAVAVNAFYVHLERDYAGNFVYHDCTAVFGEGKALLVDPAYGWFGAPHNEFVLLDDLQTIAHHYFQPAEEHTDMWLSNCRLAAKLHPDFAWGQCQLAAALLQRGQTLEAEKILAGAFRLQPDRWDAYELEGILADQQGHLDKAVVSLQKSLALNPKGSKAHFGLAHLFLKQAKPAEARQEFHSALENGLQSDEESDARRHLAELSEGVANKGVHSEILR
jgi:tetratricopeptide (TPR) repeat protein